ncbi:SDR family NAD(P)-dependent oxidoreductase [Glycomyces arizonensis]|uniref:SDR family NAD(P)-dependent oxidoreductase n=1 Tax=Glycomyces arizonensis TaxID=256035 RepID=UPI000407AE08|nr:SDR family NAD(P)-dependent oxidoreductase [Glycomyces arizonensis]
MDPAPQPGRFAGRTVIVTGAGSGIGRATALRLLAEGAAVVGVDVVPDRLDELADAEMHHDMAQGVEHSTLRTVAGDLTVRETVGRVVEAAEGRVDGLANVAGIMDGFLPPAELDDATWERVMGINVTAPMRLTRAVLPLMLEAGSGSIVNIASEASFRASTSGAAYTASKHAVVGYTKSVAFFYGPRGVRANAVVPGPVATNIEGSMRSEFAAERVGPIMRATMPPPATPEQVAAAVVWLLGDDSLNVNGAVIPSDGGWSAV